MTQKLAIKGRVFMSNAQKNKDLPTKKKQYKTPQLAKDIRKRKQKQKTTIKPFHIIMKASLCFQKDMKQGQDNSHSHCHFIVIHRKNRKYKILSRYRQNYF